MSIAPLSTLSRRLVERARPRLPWIVWQSWQELLFLHWKVDAADLRALVPPGLQIDTWRGQGWITVIPMMMVDVRVRGLPQSTALTWPQINLRTYVRCNGQRGIYFFSIDAASRVCVTTGRAMNLRMVRAPVSLRHEGRWRIFEGTRPASGRFTAAQLSARYRPRGPVFHAEPDTLTHFHTERELMFYLGRRGGLMSIRVHHPPWPLQHVDAEIANNSYLDTTGLASLLDRGRRPDLTMYSGRADTVAWPMLPVRGSLARRSDGTVQ